MKKIPELLLKCCDIIHKPHSIELLDNCIKITFYCPKCRNWIHLESKNGLDKKLTKVDSNKQSNHSPFKYEYNNHNHR